jgi:hypothetical protein
MAGEAWAMLETDLSATLESDFAAPVSLITPDGIVINTSLHGGPLLGKVQYDFREQSPGGEIIIVDALMVVLRLSSLSRVPSGSEAWAITVPTSPSDPTPRTYRLGDRAPKVMHTIGVVRLYPNKAVQS